MATATISEYSELSFVSGLALPLSREPADVEQSLTIGSVVSSSAFATTTKYVLITTDAICRVLFGANPTALSTSKRLPADFFGYFAVTGGQRVSVISST